MNDVHYALVVGIDRYPGISDLSGARADARAFADWLQAEDGGGLPAENVRLVEATGDFMHASDATPTHEHIDKALFALTRTARARLEADPDAWDRSRLYLYAAGHGFAPLGGEGALWLADAEEGAWSRNIELPQYAQWVTQCALFREVIVLADCCRDRIRDAARGLGPSLDPCPTPFRLGSVSRIVGYGSSRGSPTYEDPVGEDSDQKRGYFTRVLIEGLRGAAPIDPAVGAITAATLGGYIRQRVAELTEGKPFPQEADLQGSLGTPIVFGSPRPMPPPSAAAPAAGPAPSGARGAVPSLPILRVSSSLHALEISVWDATLQRVAHGFGGIEKPLAPGAYDVEFRAGAEVRRVAVELPADGGTLDVAAPQLEIASAAPVEGASTSFQTHRDPAMHASESLRGAPDDLGGLIVMVRTLRGQKNDRLDPALLAALTVVDPQGSDVDAGPGGFTKTLDQGFAIWKGAVPPGGYALRSTREGRSRDQALWVAAGWQTLVFVPNTPQGPAPELASIHMARLQEGWQPYERYVGLALELSLAALREGRGVVPRNMLDLLLHAKFVNPMLGIVGGHTMFTQRQPDLDLCAKVITNLDRLVPGHPDILALAARLRLRTEGDLTVATPRGGVTWPPMMLPGFGALLRLDADGPALIPDGSPAERAAATLVVNGVWSAWQPPVPRPRDDAAGRPRETSADPAQSRVEQYIRQVASVHDLGLAVALEHVSERQVALATGLPTAAVHRAMVTVGDELAQPA